MEYLKILKSIQDEIKSKVEFKKDLRTAQLLEEYVEAYESYYIESNSINYSKIDCFNNSDVIQDEQVITNLKIFEKANGVSKGNLTSEFNNSDVIQDDKSINRIFEKENGVSKENITDECNDSGITGEDDKNINRIFEKTNDASKGKLTDVILDDKNINDVIDNIEFKENLTDEHKDSGITGNEDKSIENNNTIDNKDTINNTSNNDSKEILFSEINDIMNVKKIRNEIIEESKKLNFDINNNEEILKDCKIKNEQIINKHRKVNIDEDSSSPILKQIDIDKEKKPYIDDNEFHMKIKDFITDVLKKDVKNYKNNPRIQKMAGISYAIMGKCLIRGIMFTKRNIDEAIDYFSKSASLKNPMGTFELARCFEYGIGVESDPSQAILLYRASYKLGYIKGLHRYSLLLLKGNPYINRSILDGYYVLKQAVSFINERIYLSQFYDLAMLYMSGICDIFNDHEYALKIFKLGAKKGCRYCQYKLGEEYQNGKLIEYSLEKAYFWYKKSSLNNFSEVYYKLAKILFGLEVVDKQKENTTKRIEALLVEKKTKTYNYKRNNNRRNMTELEIGVLKQKPCIDFGIFYGSSFCRLKEGYHNAFKAAISGKMEAILLVAECLENGYGTKINNLESIWWYLIAENMGAENIREKIHYLEIKLNIR